MKQSQQEDGRQHDHHQRLQKPREMVRFLGELHVVGRYFILQALGQLQVVQANALDREFLAAQLPQGSLDRVRQIVGAVGILQFAANAIAANHGDFLEFVLGEQHPEIAPFDGSAGVRAAEKEPDDHQGQYDDPQEIPAHTGSGTAARLIGRRRIGIRIRGRIGGHERSSYRIVSFTFLVPIPSVGERDRVSARCVLLSRGADATPLAGKAPHPETYTGLG